MSYSSEGRHEVQHEEEPGYLWTRVGGDAARATKTERSGGSVRILDGILSGRRGNAFTSIDTLLETRGAFQRRTDSKTQLRGTNLNQERKKAWMKPSARL